MFQSLRRHARAVGVGLAVVSISATGLLVSTTAQASPKSAVAVRPHPAAAPLDHFLCYVARGAGFKGVPGTTLKNAIQGTFKPTFKVVGAHCNPANKVIPGAKFPAKHPLAHLLCLTITSQTPSRTVTMSNQFGKGVMKTGVIALSFCLPSWKDRLGPPNMTPNQPPALDHFTCYSVTPLAAAYGFKPGSVKVEDEFSAPALVSVKLGVANVLCVPTIKILPTGLTYPLLSPSDQSLLCFPSSPTPFWKLFYDQNQFGQGPVAVPAPVKTNEHLCVPTTITAIV